MNLLVRKTTVGSWGILLSKKIIAPLEIIGLVMPADVNHVVFPGQRKLPQRFKNIIASSIHDSHWGNFERHLVTCLGALHGHS